MKGIAVGLGLSLVTGLALAGMADFFASPEVVKIDFYAYHHFIK